MKKILQLFLITAFALQAYNLKAQTCTGVDTVVYPYYKELVFSAPNDSFFIDAMVGDVRTASQAYHLTDSINVLGVQFWGGAYSTTGFPQTLQVVAYLYSVDANNMPTAVLDSTIITVTEQLEFYEGLFTAPSAITGNFAVGVRSFVNDTLAVITNNAGAAWQTTAYNESLAWRRFGSGTWNSALSFFGQDLEYMIFPIVSYSISPSFTASEDTVCSGTIVNFTNTTTGLPLDRMFNFNTFAEYWGFAPFDSSYSWDFGGGLSYSVNSSYQFTDSGTHTVTMYANMVGYYFACSDSSTMDIEVLPAYTINVDAFICPGDSILIAGNYQTAAGTYYDSLQTINGCDSVIATTLTLNPTYMINQNAAICPGDSILLGGNYQTTAGTYYDSLQTIEGCDSIIATTLAISPIYMINQNAAICPGDSILLGGNYQTTAGTYYDSLQTIEGCDSIIATTLAISPTYMMNQNATICQGDSIFLEGNYQTTAGTYYDSLQTIEGCDSIITTTLVVNPTYMINQSASICEGDSILIGGNYQSSSGTFYDSLQTIDGCDSIIAVNLTVNQLPVVSLALSMDTVCITDPAFALTGGNPAGGTFSGPGVSGGNFDPAAAGLGSHTIVYMYTDSNGCSNSDSADIFVDACLGIEALGSNTFLIYPNPSNGFFTITTKNATVAAQVVIFNAVGEKVYSEFFSGSKKEIGCNLASGIYSVQILSEKGRAISKLLIE
jgi:hypothetical protein